MNSQQSFADTELVARASLPLLSQVPLIVKLVERISAQEDLSGIGIEKDGLEKGAVLIFVPGLKEIDEAARLCMTLLWTAQFILQVTSQTTLYKQDGMRSLAGSLSATVRLSPPRNLKES